MITVITAHIHAFLHALRLLRMALLGTFFSVFVIAIALALPTIAIGVLDFVSKHITGEHLQQEVSVFLKRHLNTETLENVKNRAEQQYPKLWRFVGKEEALAQLTQALGATGLNSVLTVNPLPDTIIIVRPAKQSLREIAQQIQLWPEVDEVRIDSDWINRIDKIIDLNRTAVWLIGSVLLIVAVSVIFNTIRLQIAGHSAEIEVELLIGATVSFVRRPLVYLGTIQGLLGGFIAFSLFMLAFHFIIPALQELMTLYEIKVSYSDHWSLNNALTLLSVGMLLGWLGAWLSVWMTLPNAHTT